MIADYGEDVGSIWKFNFFRVTKMEIDPIQGQRFIDSQTRELTNTFDPPKGLSPAQYSELFVQHFTKSREESFKILDDSLKNNFKYGIVVQVGNKECLDEIEKLEKDPHFQGWENPELVNYFKNISQLSLNG
jgi:hypothetical protein